MHFDEDQDLTLDFDTAAAEPAEATLKPIPKGAYECLVKKIEMKPTKDDTGRRMIVSLKVLSGEHKGYPLMCGLNIVNKNPTAQEIARRQLAALLEACGMKGERDMSKIVGEEVIAHVTVRPARDGYDESNDIRTFEAVGSGVPSAPSSDSGKKKPGFMRE